MMATPHPMGWGTGRTSPGGRLACATDHHDSRNIGHSPPGPWLDPRSPIQVSSAGTMALPQQLHPDVRTYLVQRGVNPSHHQQRRVSAELLRASDLVIAMSTDHQAFLVDTFRYCAPLFNEICHGRSDVLLDIWEAIPTRETDFDAARHYAFQVMEYIWASIPCLLQNLGPI
jgi:protein-tyrosine-phosphatase